MNIALTFLGWIIWNFGLFSMEKDKADEKGEDFSIGHYTKCYWDNWLLSLFIIPILIILGIRGLGLEAIPLADLKGLKWNDIYYLGAGAFAEAVKYYIAVVRKKFMS